MAKKAYDQDSPDYSPGEAAEYSPEIPQSNVVQETTHQAAQPQASAPVRLAYVGPNVPSGILHRFQVFKGGLPPYCKDLFERIPEIKELFVPVEELESTRRKIEESGTNEARLFYIAQQKLAKGVK